MGMNPVIRKTTIGLYILGFWILLPATFVKTSSLLDKSGLKRRFPLVVKLIGALISTISAIMLGKAIADFAKGAGKLPVTAIPPYNRLASRGLYAVWRHPIYLFYTLLMTGIAIIAGSGGFLFVILPIFSLMVLMHAKIEEIWLIKKHGVAYVRYLKRTPLIIPKIKVGRIKNSFRGSSILPPN